jgi:hypothetical protein
MRAARVVVAEPRTTCRRASGPRVRHGVRPLAQQRLNEPFSFAVGLWAVGPRPAVSDPEARRRRGKDARDVAVAVVGEHAADPDAAGGKPARDAPDKSDGRRRALIRQDLRIGHATVVINRDVDVFPAGALHAQMAVAMNAMAGPDNAGQGLDIEMDQRAWLGGLIAMHGRRGCQARQAIQARAPQNGRHRGTGDLLLHGDLPGGAAFTPSRDDARDDVRGGPARLTLRR